MYSKIVAISAALLCSGAFLTGCSDSPAESSADATPAAANTAPEPTPVVVKKEKVIDFGITPAEFRATYNNLMNEANNKKKHDLAMPAIVLIEGDGANTFNQKFSSAGVYVLGRVSKESGKMDDLLIGMGGTADSKNPTLTALNGVLVSVIAVRSITGLDNDSGVGKAVMDLFSEAADQASKGSDAPRPRLIDNYRLSATGIKGMGILLSVSKTQ